MPEVLGLTVHAELAIVFGEEVRFWTEVELGEDFAHPAYVLPHQVLAPHLERLREVVHLLVLSCLFEVLGLGLTGPHDVPLGAIGAHYAESSCLQRVDDGVVNVGSLGDFEAEDHIVLLEVLLASHLHLLELSQVRFCRPAVCLQEACSLFHLRRCVLPSDFSIWCSSFICIS